MNLGKRVKVSERVALWYACQLFVSCYWVQNVRVKILFAGETCFQLYCPLLAFNIASAFFFGSLASATQVAVAMWFVVLFLGQNPFQGYLPNLGCFLVLRKPLLVSFCVVVWVLFSVFWIFCFTSFGDQTIRSTNKLPKPWVLWDKGKEKGRNRVTHHRISTEKAVKALTS